MMLNFISTINVHKMLPVLLTCFYATLCIAKTSFTDNSSYTQFCRAVLANETLFAEFRRSPDFIGIMETVSYEQGKECIETLTKNSPHYLSHIEKFKTSEKIGNPITFFYDQIGTIAPTTLRYIKVAFELESLFGPLDNLSIVEIGAGYGGQCKIIADLFTFKKYTIIDLPEALGVAKKFLDAHKVKNVEYLTPQDSINESSFDLVISNYAFSECTKDMQQEYVTTIFIRSLYGYCLCNQMCFGQEYSLQNDVIALLEKYSLPWQLLPENPSTNANNYLVTWKNNRQ